MGNPNQSKYDYLLSQNKNYMDLTALSTINGSVSYLQLHENIEKYEKLLISKGVRPGDRIGVCALNTPESVYLLYALDKISRSSSFIVMCIIFSISTLIYSPFSKSK